MGHVQVDPFNRVPNSISMTSSPPLLIALYAKAFQRNVPICCCNVNTGATHHNSCAPLINITDDCPFEFLLQK